MRTLNKNEVAHSVLLESLSELNAVKDKLSVYSKKYSSTFKAFEKNVKSKKQENFLDWDDYMEWKAFENIFAELNEKIKDRRGGNFRVA